MPTLIDALQIIRDNHIGMPKEFARLMWPKSDGWHRVHNIGHGASAGVGMAYAAGGFLGKLANQGLIYLYIDGCERRYILTTKGKELLAQKHS